MRLYYFTTAEHGLTAIRDRRLKIAEIDKLNDPFDFLGFELSNPKFRHFINKCKKEIAKEQGLLCFSGSWKHPLMWSHYADKHQGLCLGFDVVVPCEKMEYEPTRISMKNLRETWETPPSKLNIKEVADSFYCKFKSWEYENEYRMMPYLRDRDPISGLYFLPFESHMKLKEVLVGSKSVVKRNQLEKLLGAEADTILLCKVRPAFKTFEVVINRRKSDWK